MIKVYFDGQLECGAYVQNACVILHEDYTMRQFVNAVKEAGYVSFMTRNMKRLVEII